MRNISDKDRALIHSIAERAVKLSRDVGGNYTKMDAVMDLSSAHLHMPLRLADLLAADDFNFAHDVFGICKHMDRTQYPGKLTNEFRPRFLAK